MFRTVAFLAVITLGVLGAATPEFDAASIKRNSVAGSGNRQGARGGPPLRFQAGRVWGTTSIWRMILEAYGVTFYQISGGPSWLDSDLYGVDARSADPNADKGQLRLMLQTLLSKRRGLVIRHERQEMAIYVLTMGKNGPGPMLKKEGADPGRSSRPGGFVLVSHGPIQNLADQISNLGVSPGVADLDRPVLDKTGLQGSYQWSLNWVDAGDITGAVEEELGLKFEAQKAAMDAVVIEHVERPTEN